jgi:predicted transcriptional regulator
MKPLQEIAEELNDVKDTVKDPVKEETRKVEPTITGKKRKRED